MLRPLDELTAAQHKFAEALYKQAQTEGPGAAPDAGGAAGGETSQAKDGDVIDAEVVDDEKK